MGVVAGAALIVAANAHMRKETPLRKSILDCSVEALDEKTYVYFCNDRDDVTWGDSKLSPTGPGLYMFDVVTVEVSLENR